MNLKWQVKTMWNNTIEIKNIKMVEELNTEDYVTIGIYFVVVLAVGIWVSNSCPWLSIV